MSSEPSLPDWVCRRDGTREAFDSERIAQRLFAATAILDQPDPVLSRDLTAGVLHFLSESSNSQIHATELTDIIVKVVRELGYPELSRVLTNAMPPPPPDDPFPRDVANAIHAGMLEPFDAGSEPLFIGGVIRPGGAESLLEARKLYRRFVSIDGPEWLFDDADTGAVASWVQELRAGMADTDLEVILNFNVATPPPWAVDEGGPLFAKPPTLFTGARDAMRKELLRALLVEPPPRIRIHWHVPANGSSDAPTCDDSSSGASIVIVPDRNPEAPLLAEGLDRSNTDQLAALGIHWPAVVAHHPTVGSARDPFDAALARIPSLVALANAYFAALRRRLRSDGPAELRAGFRIDRAACTIVPLDIEESLQDCAPELASARRRLVLHSMALALASSRGMTLGSIPVGFSTGSPRSMERSSGEEIVVLHDTDGSERPSID